MRTYTAFVVLCTCLWSIEALAQGADPISGSWGSAGEPYLELAFDGKRTISGTAIFRGAGQATRTPIKTGTFDPETRAFRLEGERERPGGVTENYVIEGSVVGDTVNITLNGRTKLSFARLTDAPTKQIQWSRFFSGPDSVQGEEFVAAINLPGRNVKATGTLFIASSVRRVRAIIVLTERGPRTPMAAQGRFGDDDWRNTSAKCACGLLLFRLDTVRPIPDLTLAYNVQRNAGLGGGDALITLMNQLATETNRADFSSAPFVFWGWSGAASFGPSFALQHPERTLAFIAYHTQLVDLGTAPDVLKRIPGLFMSGGKEPGTAEAERLWATGFAAETPWAFAVEPNAPHSDEPTLVASHSLMLPWIVAIVDKRSGDSDRLRQIDLAAGLRIDQGTGRLQPSGVSSRGRPSSSWLPDEQSVKGWQLVAGKGN